MANLKILPYFPGCALKQHAQRFEHSTKTVLNEIGIELQELGRWYCCGTVIELTSDNLFRLLAPTRNLIRVQELPGDIVIVLCAMCYNTLKRTNLRLATNPTELDTVNKFMDDEPDYQCKVKVMHILELLNEESYFNKLKSRIEHKLEDTADRMGVVATYYGCLLLRPAEISIDRNPETPSIMERILKLTGVTLVDDHPFKTECCGSYQYVVNKSILLARLQTIFEQLQELGVTTLAVSCPLCEYNLNECLQMLRMKGRLKKQYQLQILYFTEILATAITTGYHHHYKR